MPDYDTMTAVEGTGPFNAGIGPGYLGPSGGPGTTTGGDFFSNNPNLLGAAAIAGAGALPFLAGGGGGLPYGPQMEGAIQNLGGTAQIAGAGYNDLYAAGRGYTGQGVDVLTSGNLPPGAEQWIKNMTTAQDTATKGRYASLGLSGSTMEGDALSNVQNQATAQRFQIAQQMGQQLIQAGGQAVQQAIQELGIQERAFGDQANAYGTMMKAQMQQDQNTANMIGNFATAMGKAIAFM